MRRHLLAVLALASIPFQGCTLGTVTIAIPDFASKAVQGVWLWRSTNFNGVYEREVQFSFGNLQAGGTGDALEYTLASGDGSPPIQITTYVGRDAVDTDKITLQLVFARGTDAAFYRASTYNESGDSPLTTEILPL